MRTKTDSRLKTVEHNADVCVVGGGMAGLIAAIAAARHGASVVLVHDRSVLGGNASSEVRMWICGARGPNRKEAGILEEIQLANLQRNPQGLYAIWDSVLFEFAKMTPGLTTLLNCSCCDAQVTDGVIVSIDAWQMSSQQRHHIEARYFIDCSGDSILAPLSGAHTRTGRESRDEFGESIAPLQSDLKTMGNSILLQLEETPCAQPFTPPQWAYYFDDASNLPSRVGSTLGTNFWWVELGGLADTIDDAEQIRDELYKTAWGVWDYMKNRGPQAERLKNWRLRWMGSVPGKRESRRYVGDYTLRQQDIDAGGKFDDIVAYGGWSMDDHHPAGLYYPGKPTIFHPAPSPYGIPYRVLYSRNIKNLFCAGRNISTTHCALSSTRVMGTCSLLGQAAGTAAALCVRRAILPAEVVGTHLHDLQEILMQDDCWLPGRARTTSPMMQGAVFSGEGNTAALLDGHERPCENAEHIWEAPAGSVLTLQLKKPQYVRSIRLVFDSDLNNNKRMPCIYPQQKNHNQMPASLVRAYRVEVKGTDGMWQGCHIEQNNRWRLAVLPLDREVRAIRFIGEAAWKDGAPIRLFSMEAHAEHLPLPLRPPTGIPWTAVTAAIPAQDMQAPDNGLEAGSHCPMED